MAKPKKAKLKSGDYSIAELASKLNGMFGSDDEPAVQILGQQAAADVPAISTGSLAIDCALGIGGIGRNRIIEIYGPEASGKTTLCLHTIATVHKSDPKATCAFIDTEHALDPIYAETIGVDRNRILISQPNCGEDALELAEAIVRSKSVDLIVIDSVASLVPRAEIEGQMGDSHMGLQARLMSQACRKLTGIINKNDTTVIFTNQIRMKIGVMFGSPETTSGGNALKFYASQRIDIRKGEYLYAPGTTKDNSSPIGNKVRVKIVKNKLAAPFIKCETRILHDGTGFDRFYDIINYGVKADIFEKKGSWYAYDGENIGQGSEAAIEYLRELDEDSLTALEGAIFEALRPRRASELEDEDESEIDLLREEIESLEGKLCKKKLKDSKRKKLDKKLAKLNKKLEELEGEEDE